METPIDALHMILIAYGIACSVIVTFTLGIVFLAGGRLTLTMDGSK